MEAGVAAWAAIELASQGHPMSVSTIPPKRPTTSKADALTPAAPAPSPMPPGLYRFNVDQYERMVEAGILTEDDRVELIDGYVVTKMAKGPAHVGAAKRAGDRLEALLGDDLSLRREAPARIPEMNEPEPDLAVARGAPATYDERHPDASEIAMVIEVSDTTYHRDRYEKLPHFARSRIPVYWIVHLPARRIEVYTRPVKTGAYRSRKEFQPGEHVPVIIDGRHLGNIAVNDILPRPPAVPAADHNGA
jgi:Uma2 family endonuclease